MSEGFERFRVAVAAARTGVCHLAVRDAKRLDRHITLVIMPESFDLLRLFLAAGTDSLTQALFGASRLSDNFPITESVRVSGLIACRKHRKPAHRKGSRKQQNAEFFHKFPPCFFEGRKKARLRTETRPALRYLRLSPNNFQSKWKEEIRNASSYHLL